MFLRLLRLARLASIRSASLAAAVAALAYAGCSNDALSSLGVTHPTLIEVSPEEFMGQVPCTESGPGLRRYVATLFDRTEQVNGGAGGEASEAGEATSAGAGGASASGDAVELELTGFQLPSSTPTPCGTAVAFGFVVPGRFYGVEIDGYASTAIEPRGLGTQQMVLREPDPEHPDDATLAKVTVVEPDWHTVCPATMASGATIVRARDCFKLTLGDSAAPASATVDTSALLGSFECGDEPGQIAELDVTLAGSTQRVPCGAVAVFPDLTARAKLSGYVEAFAKDSTNAFAGSECHVVPVAGADVPASCARLTDRGTLRVNLPRALGQLGTSCDSSISDVLVRIPGEEDAEQRFPPPDCLQPFDHGFAAGAAAIVNITVLGVSGAGGADSSPELGSLSCHGDVFPGRLVDAICDLVAAP